MREIVGLSDADDRHGGIPHLESFGGQSVRAAVVWHLEHIDLPECAALSERTPDRLLGISCKQRRERAASHLQDDTGVIRRQGGVGPLGPEDLDLGPADPQGISRREGFRLSRPTASPEYALDITPDRGERLLLVRDRHEDTLHPGQTDKA
jgi:hypothetical protein